MLIATKEAAAKTPERLDGPIELPLSWELVGRIVSRESGAAAQERRIQLAGGGGIVRVGQFGQEPSRGRQRDHFVRLLDALMTGR